MSAIVAVALLSFGILSAKADVLSDNLSNVTAGTEIVTGSTLIPGSFAIAASFATDAKAYALSSATLLLANPVPGAAQLDLYSNTGQPGSLLSVLTSPAGYSNGLSPVTFASNGFSLSPSSTYWLVLKATSGEFQWGWTADDTGAGVGFTHTWGAMDNAGEPWLIFETEPMQFSVTGAPTAAIPEPSAWALAMAGGILLLNTVGRQRRAAHRNSTVSVKR